MKRSNNRIEIENVIKIVDDLISLEKLERPDPSGKIRILNTINNIDVHVAESDYWNKAFRITVATIGLAASVAIGIGLGGIYSRTPDYYENSVMVHDAQIENLDYLIEE
jgi:hypothetical protein